MLMRQKIVHPVSSRRLQILSKFFRLLRNLCSKCVILQKNALSSSLSLVFHHIFPCSHPLINLLMWPKIVHRTIRSRQLYTDYVSSRWYRAPEVLLLSTNVADRNLSCGLYHCWNVQSLSVVSRSQWGRSDF